MKYISGEVFSKQIAARQQQQQMQQLQATAGTADIAGLLGGLGSALPQGAFAPAPFSETNWSMQFQPVDHEQRLETETEWLRRRVKETMWEPR